MSEGVIYAPKRSSCACLRLFLFYLRFGHDGAALLGRVYSTSQLQFVSRDLQ